MNRQRKIQALLAIQSGLLMPGDIAQADQVISYNFHNMNEWCINDRYLNDTEYEAFKKEYEACNKRLIDAGLLPGKILILHWPTDTDPLTD